MKVKNVVLVIAVLLLVMGHQPAQAGVNVGVSVGLPVFALPAPPQLVVIPGTYAYYVADADVDIIFYQGRWYRPWGGRWYWARGYNGPWVIAGPRFVPALLFRLPRDFRRGSIYERIPYYDLNRNWRSWERERRWERRHDWWRKARDEHRRDRREVRKDRRERKEDRREFREDRRERIDDRKERKEDLREKREDRRERKEDLKERREDRRDRK